MLEASKSNGQIASHKGNESRTCIVRVRLVPLESQRFVYFFLTYAGEGLTECRQPWVFYWLAEIQLFPEGIQTRLQAIMPRFDLDK